MNWQAMTREELLNYAPSAVQSELERALLEAVEGEPEDVDAIEQLENDVANADLALSDMEQERDDLQETINDIIDILDSDDSDADKLSAIKGKVRGQ